MLYAFLPSERVGITVTNMTDLIQETKDQLHEERVQALARKYAPWAIGGLVAIIIAVGGFQLFKSWNNGVLTKQTSAYITARDTGDLAAAASKMRPKLAALALLSSNTQVKGAKYPRELRELSTISSPDVSVDELIAIASRDASPWRARAYLRAAVLVSQTDSDKAVQYLDYVISDVDAPRSIKQKAGALRKLYLLEAGTPKPIQETDEVAVSDVVELNEDAPIPQRKPAVE